VSVPTLGMKFIGTFRDTGLQIVARRDWLTMKWILFDGGLPIASISLSMAR
jgi:hypothetical protein